MRLPRCSSRSSEPRTARPPQEGGSAAVGSFQAPLVRSTEQSPPTHRANVNGRQRRLELLVRLDWATYVRVVLDRLPSMGLFEYILLAFSSLFVIVDPVALAPLFLAMTPNDGPAMRERMARIASLTACGVLFLFVVAGPWVFHVLGITLAAFQIAGSILLLLVALDMVHARPSRVHVTPEETEEGAAKDDVAVSPLGVPMLAGPGAITTVLILRHRAANLTQQLALVGIICLVCLLSYVILRLAARSARWISPLAMLVLSRLMGLLLAAIAVQFLLDGLQHAGLWPTAAGG